MTRELSRRPGQIIRDDCRPEVRRHVSSSQTLPDGREATNLSELHDHVHQSIPLGRGVRVLFGLIEDGLDRCVRSQGSVHHMLTRTEIDQDVLLDLLS